MASADDEIAVGLAPEDNDDTHEDAAVLFGNHVGSGSAAPIDLDGGSNEGETMTGTLVCSNGSTPSAVGTSTSSGPGVGKRKSVVWADFDEIYETVNGRKICTKATCKCVSIRCLLDLLLALAT